MGARVFSTVFAGKSKKKNVKNVQNVYNVGLQSKLVFKNVNKMHISLFFLSHKNTNVFQETIKYLIIIYNGRVKCVVFSSR